MKQALLKFGRFLRIIDESQTMISLTNTAMWVVIAKILLAPTFTVEELGAFFVALLAYSGKKMLNGKNGNLPTTGMTEMKRDINILNDQISEVKDRLGQVAVAAGFKKRTDV